MSRALLRVLLLALVLLLTELGGIIHALTHQQEEADRPPAACQLCVAYAAFDHAHLGKAPPAMAAAGTSLARPRLPDGIGQHCRLLYRSRAPPSSLV